MQKDKDDPLWMDGPKEIREREEQKVLNFSKRYGSKISKLNEICDCALSLEKIAEEEWENYKRYIKYNRTDYQESDCQDIWDWYHNQRGGKCYG